MSGRQPLPLIIGRPWWVLLVALLLGSYGCGGGGGGSSAALSTAPVPADETGEIAIALTDAEGDFESYVVDVDYIRLERANGDVVETVPLTTRIDFVELTELTEFLTVATIPVGTYTSVIVGMDFSAAEILVQETDGDVVPALPVDASGAPLGRLELVVWLPNDEPVRIAPGVPAHVTLDFDLDASNTVDLSPSPVEVMVEPFLLVTADLERDREHRVRGLLGAVDEAQAEITLKVRPFHQRSGEFGRFTFLVDPDTVYEIDGERFDGDAGLAAMVGLAMDTPVVTHGAVTDAGLLADVVIAGSSVPWADVDVVKGVVTARLDDALTVRGVRIAFRDTVTFARGEFTVLVAETTRVGTWLIDTPLGHQDISVGQRITAAGELANERTLDATNGGVRLNISQLTAEVLGNAPLVVDLSFLSGLRPGAYDFSGTGSTPAEDADPNRYEVDSASLALPGIETGDLVRVRGLVNGFGMAPPDFNAHTVIDVHDEALAATLLAGWDPAQGMPFSSIAPARIDVDLGEARHVLKLRGVMGATDLGGIALLAPGEDVRSAYVVAVRGAGELHMYRHFADLVSELERQLADGKLLRRIAAHGRYNATTVELTAARASFEFIAP